MDDDDEYQVIGGVLYKLDDGVLEVEDDDYITIDGVVYKAEDRDYHGYSESKHDRYSVELDADGNVVAFNETKRNGRIENEMDGQSTYAFEDGQLVETEMESDGSVEITRYADLDGDGFFTKVSEQYMAADVTTQKFAITSAMSLVGSDTDDVIALADDTPVIGGAGQDQFVMREIGDAVVSDYNHDDDDQIIFDTGLGLSSTEQLASFVSAVDYDEATTTLSVDFGGVATLTIVGIQADQISWDIVSVLS